MLTFIPVWILILTIIGFCDGFSVKILMDRVDNMEYRIDNLSKIRRQEMAAVYERLTVIDSLEANVEKLMSIVETQSQPVERNQVNRLVDHASAKPADIKHLKNLVLNAFRREKEENVKLREDCKRLQSEFITTLYNHTLKQSNALNDLAEKVNSDVISLNKTVNGVNSALENVTSQTKKNTDLGQELVSRIEQVINNITAIQYNFDVITKEQKKFETPLDETSDILNEVAKPESCAILKKLGHSSGIYEIWKSGNESALRVFCDQDTDGGGWIVFQRRKSGSVDFDRNWKDYKEGFGDLNGEFWLGNDAVNMLTSNGSYELRVDMEDFDKNKAYARYTNFRILSEDDHYRLEVSGYTGTAGDSLDYHNNKPFSTKDNWNGVNEYCKRYKAGWWFENCFYSNLNGQYYHRKPPSAHLGIIWYYWLGSSKTVKFTEMKFRQT